MKRTLDGIYVLLFCIAAKLFGWFNDIDIIIWIISLSVLIPGYIFFAYREELQKVGDILAIIFNKYLPSLSWSLISLVCAVSTAVNLYSFSMADRAVMVLLTIAFGYQSYKRYKAVK